MLFTPIKREHVFDTRVDASQDLSGRYSIFLVLETFLKSALSAIVELRCDTIFTLIALKNVFFFCGQLFVYMLLSCITKCMMWRLHLIFIPLKACMKYE